jgi:hypothetical protein
VNLNIRGLNTEMYSKFHLFLSCHNLDWGAAQLIPSYPFELLKWRTYKHHCFWTSFHHLATKANPVQLIQRIFVKKMFPSCQICITFGRKASAFCGVSSVVFRTQLFLY